MLVRLTMQTDTRGLSARVKASVLGFPLPEAHAFLRGRGEPRVLFGFRRREWALFTRELIRQKPKKKPNVDLRWLAARAETFLAVHSATAHGIVGTGDAALTALCSGALWTLFAPVFPLVSRWKVEPRIAVEPDFRAQVFSVRCSCMFTLRMGHLVIAYLFRKRRGQDGSSH